MVADHAAVGLEAIDVPPSGGLPIRCLSMGWPKLFAKMISAFQKLSKILALSTKIGQIGT
ncbi:MAG: hypothetical protein P4L82_02910 [Ancalomicrobiaceae bacterium]|nr:hypothetical protein [Ancalomicrobiaceae bacterium]